MHKTTKSNDKITKTTVNIAGLKKGRGGNQRVSPFVVPRRYVDNKIIAIHCNYVCDNF